MNLVYKVAICVLSASLASIVGAQASHNWTSSDGTVWKVRVLVANDYHAIASVRAVGTQPGDPMSRAPEQRVRIW